MPTMEVVFFVIGEMFLHIIKYYWVICRNLHVYCLYL